MYDYITPKIVAAGELTTRRGYGVLGNGSSSRSEAIGGASLEELQERIDAFKSRDLETLTDSEMSEAVYDIMFGKTAQSITFVKSMIPIHSGTSFFRARWLGDWKSQMRSTDDVREPKPHYVERAGRLNTSGESILYTTLGTPATAVWECRFVKDDVFAMNRFVARGDFNATVVGLDPLLPGLSGEDSQKLQIIQGFLAESFTYRVEPDYLEPYRLSRMLALDFWHAPSRVSRAWAFSSIMDQTGQGWNVCFEPHVGQQALLYKESHIYRITRFDESDDRPVVELIAAFTGARGDKLVQMSPQQLQGVQPWL